MYNLGKKEGYRPSGESKGRKHKTPEEVTNLA